MPPNKTTVFLLAIYDFKEDQIFASVHPTYRHADNDLCLFLEKFEIYNPNSTACNLRFTWTIEVSDLPVGVEPKYASNKRGALYHIINGNQSASLSVMLHCGRFSNEVKDPIKEDDQRVKHPNTCKQCVMMMNKRNKLKVRYEKIS